MGKQTLIRIYSYFISTSGFLCFGKYRSTIGKILCMVSKPTYDPNQLEANWERLTQASSDNSSLYNRATQGLYPPGSTFKLYTLLEYMRENEDFNKFSYRCTGKIGTGDGSIRCYGNEVHGKINLKQAFAESCNAAFAQIGSGLNTKSWTKLCEQFASS